MTSNILVTSNSNSNSNSN